MQKKWKFINNELTHQNFDFEFKFTKHKKHSSELIKEAIKHGFTNFISVGGDGTLHNIVNGVLSLNPTNISEIKIGIIAVNYKKAIDIIKSLKTINQDIGKLTISSTNKTVYFNNLTGIGFDGYVVNKVNSYKKLGFLAYLVGALVSLTRYKKSTLEIAFNNIILKGKTLMLLIGLCKYSDGRMQLTKDSNPIDGLFDISYIKNITLLTILGNIKSLFNCKITNHKLNLFIKSNCFRYTKNVHSSGWRVNWNWRF